MKTKPISTTRPANITAQATTSKSLYDLKRCEGGLPGPSVSSVHSAGILPTISVPCDAFANRNPFRPARACSVRSAGSERRSGRTVRFLPPEWRCTLRLKGYKQRLGNNMAIRQVEPNLRATRTGRRFLLFSPCGGEKGFDLFAVILLPFSRAVKGNFKPYRSGQTPDNRTEHASKQRFIRRCGRAGGSLCEKTRATELADTEAKTCKNVGRERLRY